MKKVATIKTIILLTSVFCFFNACKKPHPSDDDTNDTNKTDNTCLHVVWSKPFLDENTSAVMQDPIIVDGYVVFAGYQQFSVADLTNRINVFDKTNGEMHPSWTKCIEEDLGYGISEVLLGGENKDVLFYSTSRFLHAIRLDRGWRFWTAVHESSNTTVRPSVLGSDVIVPYFTNVTRYNSTTGQKTTLFSFDGVVKTIQWAINEHNDTVLFFTDGWEKVFCYNLTKDNVSWECTLSTEHEGTSFLPIIVENKYVLFQHRYYVSCVDFSTGKLIWTAMTNGWIEDNPILYYDGKIIVRPNYGNITCYDVRNGNLLWTSSNVGMSTNSTREYGKMDVYKGNLYFTTGGTKTSYLYCLSLTTGSINWFDAGPADRGIYGGLTIDQQTGYLYCHSIWSVMCVDLNKTPKK